MSELVADELPLEVAVGWDSKVELLPPQQEASFAVPQPAEALSSAEDLLEVLRSLDLEEVLALWELAVGA